MADRTIKPDDTNDLVLQNNDGSAKIELNEDQTVKVTIGSDSGEDFSVNSTKLVVEGDTGNVGIGTNTPEHIMHLADVGVNSFNTQAVFDLENTRRSGYTQATLELAPANSGGTFRPYAIAAELIGDQSASDLVFYSNTTEAMRLTSAGALSKSSGSFKIDHPIESKKETHYLVHSFIEGPQADLIYRGRATLVNGKATVNIDNESNMTEGTFVKLNTNTQFFLSNNTGFGEVKGSLLGNILTIEAKNNTSTDTISWMVVGERKDNHMIETDWTDENGKVIVELAKKINQNPY